MDTAQSFAYWYLATGVHSSILPSSIWNNEFEDNMFIENESGHWILNTNHPRQSQYVFEAFKNIVNLLFSVINTDGLLYLGYNGEITAIEDNTVINLIAIMYDTKNNTLHSITDTTSKVNTLYTAIKNIKWLKPKYLRFQLSFQNTTKERIELPCDIKSMTTIHGSLAWWHYENSLTGLALDPQIAYTYKKPWSAAAIDILLNTSLEHAQVFKKLWSAKKFTKKLLKQVNPKLPELLVLVDSLYSCDTQWYAELNYALSDERTKINTLSISDLV